MRQAILDHFADISGWQAITSGRAELVLSQATGPAGQALRLDFDFHGGGGFVVARRLFCWQPPESYSFAFQLRGVAPRNHFEFKLVDASGRNVWRHRAENLELPADWTPWRIRNSQIEFAWGPLGGGPARDIAALEIAIAAGQGGRGSVWLAELDCRDDSYRAVPVVTASSALPGHDAYRAVTAEGGWQSADAEPQWLLIDFQQEREYGGLRIEWAPGLAAREFAVCLSTDGTAWTTAYATRQAGGDVGYAYLPGAVSRYLRLDLAGSAGRRFGIRRIEVKPYEFSRSLNGFWAGIAQERPAGFYPKYLLNRQSYWTPTGPVQGGFQALMNEEGMVEVAPGGFSIEPFLYADGRLFTWDDGERTLGLERDALPIPFVTWRAEHWRLRVTACAAPESTATDSRPVLYLRYRVENTAPTPRPARLYLAIRPFQVTPTWQHWRDFGGVAALRTLSFRDGVAWANGDRAVIPLQAADGFGAAAFAAGAVTEYLAAGRLPDAQAVDDEFGYASGAVCFELALAAGAARELWLAVPFGRVDPAEVAGLARASGPERHAVAVRDWAAEVDRVELRLPSQAQAFADTFKTAAAHILVNRDGPALHPGPRRYRRAWLRDGVLMGAALLRVGCGAALRDFLRWYAGFQAGNGALPDCADPEAVEWLPEFDAYGQFIYGVAEYWRFTGDADFVRDLQAAVWKALTYLETLRAQRLTADYYQTPELRACYGLLPESMSHEGYMAHPVHAYWDDFWALRGFKDAAALAGLLGERAEAARLAALGEEFAGHLYASLDATMARHGIDFLPGSVEFGDFDPAATAIALAPADEIHRLPRPALDRTFDRYLDGFRERAANLTPWNNYSAYEIRIVGALVRLGRRRDALELMEFLLADRRPRGWNQWPEISWRDPDGPGFIGDLPHAWIGAEYILAARSLFAYEREADSALVIAAGLAAAWLADGATVGVVNLPTWHGPLSYRLNLEADGLLRLTLDGGVNPPPGGIVALPPLARPIARVRVDGAAWTEFTADSLTLRTAPAEVAVEF